MRKTRSGREDEEEKGVGGKTSKKKEWEGRRGRKRSGREDEEEK